MAKSIFDIGDLSPRERQLRGDLLENHLQRARTQLQREDLELNKQKVLAQLLPHQVREAGLRIGRPGGESHPGGAKRRSRKLSAGSARSAKGERVPGRAGGSGPTYKIDKGTGGLGSGKDIKFF